MKKLIIIFLILLLCFGSCEATAYKNSLSCKDITYSLQDELTGYENYKEYGEADVGAIIRSDNLYDSCSVIYSVSSDDIGEIGIFHASNEADIDQLLEESLDHIKALKDEKQEFLRNYLPDELIKLNYADARAFGNYVVYTVLAADESEEVFSFVQKLLSK